MIALVGATWRDGPSGWRARLLEADGPDGPLDALFAAGTITGAARIETCSRVEWVISAENATWAANLLQGGLLARVGPGRGLRVRHGRAAVAHVLRVALGLDAVVEGEAAVGRQVLRAFEAAHDAGRTDKPLHLLWRAVGDALHDRGRPPGTAGGVHSLAAAEVATLGKPRAIAVLGTGEIGKKVLRAIPSARGFARKDLDEFTKFAATADAVVVCTGAPSAWVDLPPGSGLAVDVGAPRQIRSAEGWRLVDLDRLLERQVPLPEAESRRLESLADAATDRVLDALRNPADANVLGAIDDVRRSFMEELPEILEGLPEERARLVRSRVARFGHRVIKAARKE